MDVAFAAEFNRGKPYLIEDLIAGEHRDAVNLLTYSFKMAQNPYQLQHSGG
jgi:hypothetical protein